MLFFSLFFKFYLYVSKQLGLQMIDVQNDSNTHVVNISKYAQYYHIDPKSQSPNGAIGKPLVHKSAIQQATGNILLLLLLFDKLKHTLFNDKIILNKQVK